MIHAASMMISFTRSLFYHIEICLLPYGGLAVYGGGDSDRDSKDTSYNFCMFCYEKFQSKAFSLCFSSTIAAEEDRVVCQVQICSLSPRSADPRDDVRYFISFLVLRT